MQRMHVRSTFLYLLGALGLIWAGCGDSAMTPAPPTPDLLVSAPPDLGCGTACPCTCPGQALGSADVVCGQDMGQTCQLTCRGENYDVDADPKNGCEMNHSNPPGHSEADAADRGHLSCFDTSTDTFLEFLLSDSRVHANPVVGSFNSVVGSAPDYWRVHADGGAICVNDYDVTFATSGGGTDQCYECTVITDKKTQHVLATGKDLVHLTSGSGSYTSKTDIYFKIEKICSLPRQEGIRYSIMYHL